MEKCHGHGAALVDGTAGAIVDATNRQNKQGNDFEKNGNIVYGPYLL